MDGTTDILIGAITIDITIMAATIGTETGSSSLGGPVTIAIGRGRPNDRRRASRCKDDIRTSERLMPRHRANEIEISHGRVSWQTRRGCFAMEPLASSAS
jgi:hypothetical protein